MAWERLAHVELSGSNATLDSGTFSGKKNLRIICLVTGKSQSSSATIQFNSDTGSNYPRRFSIDGGSDSTETGGSAITHNTQDANPTYFEAEITNISDQEKLYIGHAINQGSSGAGAVPSRCEAVNKWTNTSAQITSIQVNASGGTFGSGSYITVLGAKEPATADSITVDGGADSTITYSTDFSSSTGWTQEGSWVQISGGKVAFSGGSNSDHRIHRAIGATLSDTKWVMRFKYNSKVNDFGYMVLSSGTANPDSDNTDWVGLYAGGSDNNGLTLAWGDSASMSSGSWVGSLSTNTDYYIQVTRESATSAKMVVYSDSGYSVEVGSSTTSSLPSSITSLSNIVLASITEGGASSGYSWEVDDLKIYDDVTSTRTSFAAKKHLMIQLYVKGSGAIQPHLRFNGDTGSNYARRTSFAGAADSTVASHTEIKLHAQGSDTPEFCNINVINVETKEKLVISETVAQNAAGAANVPTRQESVGKWANTSDSITSVTAVNGGAGDFDDGSEMVVWGTD